MNHLGNRDNVDDHGWINVHANWVEYVGVEIGSADKAAEADTGKLREVLDRDGDGKDKWEDPAEPC